MDIVQERIDSVDEVLVDRLTGTECEKGPGMKRAREGSDEGVGFGLTVKNDLEVLKKM